MRRNFSRRMFGLPPLDPASGGKVQVEINITGAPPGTDANVAYEGNVMPPSLTFDTGRAFSPMPACDERPHRRRRRRPRRPAVPGRLAVALAARQLPRRAVLRREPRAARRLARRAARIPTATSPSPRISAAPPGATASRPSSSARDYDQDRDDLIDAVFNVAGPGTLVHPYLGTIEVQMMDGCSSASRPRRAVSLTSTSSASRPATRWPSARRSTPPPASPPPRFRSAHRPGRIRVLCSGPAPPGLPPPGAARRLCQRRRRPARPARRHFSPTSAPPSRAMTANPPDRRDGRRHRRRLPRRRRRDARRRHHRR